MALGVRAWVALVAFSGVTACGTAADDPLLGAARSLGQTVFDLSDPAPAPDPRQILTRAAIDQAGLPLLLVETVSTGVAVTMVRSAVNGANETWQGDGDASVTLSREGVLRATRGTGADLEAADISQTRAALSAGRATAVERLYVHVVGDLELRRTTYTCDLTRAGSESISIFGQGRAVTQVTERCRVSGASDAGLDAFENRYWVDATGFVWVSEQWVGPELGHLRFERLYR